MSGVKQLKYSAGTLEKYWGVEKQYGDAALCSCSVGGVALCALCLSSTMNLAIRC